MKIRSHFPELKIKNQKLKQNRQNIFLLIKLDL